MRAIVCHAFEGYRNLVLEELPAPELSAEWVLIGQGSPLILITIRNTDISSSI